MAFQTGTSTSMENLLTQLSMFLQANGWTETFFNTITADVGSIGFSKNGIFVSMQYTEATDNGTMAIYQALAGAHPNFAVYRREEIPAHFEYSGHERIPPIVGICDDGWTVTTKAHFEGCPRCFEGGAHGYDQHLESMGALLIAYGPSFRRQTQIGPIENFHLYNVMCAVLGLEPAPNSGDPARVGDLIRSP